MSLVDPTEPLDIQLARQSKIIEALIRRSNRQNDIGLSAYGAFQSAIELQAQVAAKTRDLEIAANELEVLRFDQQSTRASLNDVLASMDGGFALFSEDQLIVHNDQFRDFLPDISREIGPGLKLIEYFYLVGHSTSLKSIDHSLSPTDAVWREGAPAVKSRILELKGDRWFQLNMQRMESERVVLLLTEISSIVRQSQHEKETLIDAQAAYLQAMFEDMSSGVCTFDPGSEVMQFNRAFRELLGLPFMTLQKGVSFERLMDYLVNNSLLTAPAVQQLREWRRGAHGPGPLQTRVRKSTQQVLDVHAKFLPDGGILIELKDVTLESRTTEMLEKRVRERTAELTQANEQLILQYEQQARVEEELRLAKEQAEAANTSKTRFLAAASHDLLQPINAAKLILAALSKTAEETEFHPNILRLGRAFRSTEQLLHSLLDISRLEGAASDTFVPTEVYLGAMMQGIYEDQLPVAEQRGVELRVVPSHSVVRSDAVYLLRSLQNLVVNAIQYSREGGRVLFGCRRRGDKVLLQVWDNGIGIEAVDQARIFEEFTRGETASAGTGVGLGLSVVERACRHLGHKLWLKSKPGRGSVFCIEMDLLERAAPGDSARKPLSSGGDQQMDLIVLLVENDENVRFATTQMLEYWGADVLPVTSTEEALRHVRDMGIPPDIILADYHLDHADTGVRAIAQVRELTGADVPAIVITANRAEDLIAEGRELGFAVMTKPVQVSRLRPMIEWLTAHSMDGQGPELALHTTDKSRA